MGVISKAVEKAGEDGIPSLLRDGPVWVYTRSRKRLRNAVSRVHVRFPVFLADSESGLAYQFRRSEGVKQRWELLQPHLREETSVLDVGCNAGLLTAEVSRSGRFAIGVEANSATVADAVEYHGRSRDFALVNKRITPVNVHTLPIFDYVFLFSVYHQLYSHYGRDTAEGILYDLTQKASDTLFFEAASQKCKYDDPALPFEDFDEASIRTYHVQMLEDVCDGSATVEYVGSSSRHANARGQRHMFAVDT